jgi:NDP-sugar pyrophosphorylase family protein/aminoglycoside/choline kinase family phosphotransferase
MNLSVFILAAGLGERLHPITDHFPKPLLPILGTPILQSILEKVSTLPAHKIGINLYHKKELIETWIRQSAFNKKVELFPEDSMLGTGGALKNADVFLKNNLFLVHNSDIVSDINLEKLLNFHLSSDNLVTLAAHDYPKFNNLAVDEQQLLRGVCKANSMPSKSMKLLAFTGIAVYSPEFLKFLPSGFSSVVNAWLEAVESGHKIGTFDVTGCYWSDIGTPASYASTIINALRQNGEYVYIHPSIEICRHVELDGYVVAEEDTSLDKGVSLRNCILLPGSTPPIPPLTKGSKGRLSIENCILGPGFKIDLNESEMLGFPKGADALLIGIGGSDRQYYRIKSDGKKEVLMQCSTDDPDFQRHIEYTWFFRKYSILVPELLHVESEKMNAVFEDLGDLSLYSYLKCPREQKEIEEVYKRIIDILILIHTVATKHITECPLLQNRIFDYEHLRWETTYFIERFLQDIRDIKVKNLSALYDEFHRLALKVDSFPKTIVHRDFQSQNIMITKGGIPRVLDYQSARIGPPAYDVASLLWDPYYRLEDHVRERLLDYYVEKIKKACSNKIVNANNPPSPPFNSPLTKGARLPSVGQGSRGVKKDKGGFFNKIEFKQTLLCCRLQRHMQALGAYGFLSKIKGKKYFMKHVPEGMRLLKEDAFLSKDRYPVLYDLTKKL